MVANAATVESANSARLVSDEPLYLYPARRGTPALIGADARPRPAADMAPLEPEAAARAALLAYAAFVLDQEAKYCQQ